MNNPLILPSKPKIIVIIIALLVTVVLLWSKCNQQNTNVLISDIRGIQITETGKLNDSINYYAQNVLIAENKKQIVALTSALQKQLLRKINIDKTSVSVEFRDSLVAISIPNNKQSSVIELVTEPSPVHVVMEQPKNIYPLKFTHSNPYLKESYTVLSADSSMIDSLQIIGKGHLVIGQSGKWYQKKTIKVGLVNENPYFIVTDIKSIAYLPKPKMEISVGPVLMMNKTSVSGGVGVTVKKGIFSISAGYKIF